MQLTGQVLGACVIILCHNLCTGTTWEDEDTVIIEAATEENGSLTAAVGEPWTRTKRQIGSNSIFGGIPGWGMFGNGFGGSPPGFGGGLPGFGGFKLPGFDGGMQGIFQFPMQPQPVQPQPVQQPQPSPPNPVKPVESSCYTSNGELGQCAQFRQCYPLLFSSADDEQRNPGLAYALKSSAGTCTSNPQMTNGLQNYDWWYRSEVSERQNQICCSNESPIPTMPITTTQKPQSWPGWPPQSHTMPPVVTQSTTWPSWTPPENQWGHQTPSTTMAPQTQRTTWPAWTPPPQSHWGHQTPSTTTMAPTTQRTPWPAWPPQSHWGQQTPATNPPHWGHQQPATNPPHWGHPTPVTNPPHWGHQQPATNPPYWGHQTPATTQQTPVEPYNCPGGYIIGGTTVQGRKYPFVVSIKDGRTNRHVCGGSLLSARSVLTAAHCVKQLGPQQVAGLRAFLGTNDIAGSYNNPCVVVRKVRNIKYHRGFSMRTLHDDIAILTLESAVPVGGNIQTVSLSGTRIGAGGKATVTGWGGLHLGGQPVGNLRDVTLDVIGNDLCAAKYVGSAPAGVTQHMLCAGSNGRDACLGDSGGPLIMNGQQVGIVSFGTGCGTLPGVYTRISSYISWINKNIS